MSDGVEEVEAGSEAAGVDRTAVVVVAGGGEEEVVEVVVEAVH